ncbi:hypothetical protein TNCV_446781 [Trichonephila clavipes]|nr:hypothetical protein TNCV_446781 [Trichonephila clavipes]
MWRRPERFYCDDVKCTHVQKTGSGATRKTTRREDRRIVRQALVDPTVTRSTIRADVGVDNFQTPCRSKS